MTSTPPLKLGLALGYWGKEQPADQAATVALAEELGFDSVWTSEAYGSDALTPLAWIGASTSRVRLGTSVIQLSARTPTATAMAALTMDHLSGGRFVLGIGASGPQVVEGWYGQPYPRPLARTREYISILRQAFARERVAFEGEHYHLPAIGGSGLGKALRPTLHPVRESLPILLAAEGPKNVALAAEVADGWIALFYSPHDDAHYRASLAEGFARPGAHSTPETFEVTCPVTVELDDDVEVAADRVRPFLSLYIGGMGASSANFHRDVFVRMGYEEECATITRLFSEGRRDEAAATVPLSMVEKVALVGPRAKIADDLEAWRESLVTTILLDAAPDTMRVMAELVP